MRTMFILRGAPASGKSTFIKENNLEPYTLCADNIRQIYESPALNMDGSVSISQKNDASVLALLLELLECRMERGEFICIDATYYKSSLLANYKKLVKKYYYRAFIVDFTHIPIEEVLERNRNRKELARVPETVIHKMYTVFQDDNEVNSLFKVLTPDEAINMLKKDMLFDYNNYDKIVAFGDIHGCFEPVKAYFNKYPFNENTAYIFLGDYIDRGIQNKEVLEFLINICSKKNVMLLEGNHEKWLRMYINDIFSTEEITKEEESVIKKYFGVEAFKRLNHKNKIRSSEFINKTIPQINSISKNGLKILCNKLAQMAYFSFGHKKYFFCHGGIPVLPNLFISAETMIRGTEDYKDVLDLYDSWNKNTPEDIILVHGHRNISNLKAKQKRAYNLCSDIEFGMPLRILTIDKNNNEIVEEFENPVYNQRLRNTSASFFKEVIDEKNIIEQLNSSNLIIKKELDNNIVSYNFSHSAFQDKRWNNLICKARGLFVNASDNTVVARSYNKFFNLEEMPETKLSTLVKTLVFPLTAYKKENGFLILLSYDKKNDSFRFCSKSKTSGKYVDIAKKIFYSKIVIQVFDALKDFLNNHNCTMVFECIDSANDPHIIEYKDTGLILLDIIDNDFKTKRSDIVTIEIVAKSFGFACKKEIKSFNNYLDFFNFIQEVKDDYSILYEGWVFEDSNGFMFKLKSAHYLFWKKMCTILKRIKKNQGVNKSFISKENIEVYNLMKKLKAENKLSDKNILDIKKIFYANKNHETVY